MDGIRFDNLTRKLSRRKAVSVAGATSLAAAMTKVLPSQAQGGGTTCQMGIQALTSAGPSFGQAYSGLLEITLRDDGGVNSGSFTPEGGLATPVVGQADGRAVSLRIMFADGQSLVLTGTGENEIEMCSGALSGVFGGPKLGDTGSWTIDPSLSELISSGTNGSGSTTATSTPVGSATAIPACPEVECDVTYVIDPTTCECVCPVPYESCGPACCPAGSECMDEMSGTCSCPFGTELCGDACVGSCPMLSYLDYDTCQCVEGCDLICLESQQLEPDTCSCVDICSGGTPHYCGGNCYGEAQVSCSGVCYPASSVSSNQQMCGAACQVCPVGVPCIAGSCQCPATYNYCQGVGCKSLSDDNNNCGACGNVCSGGKTCQGGMCQL